MVNVLTGLAYKSKYKKLENEDQLLEIFSELKQYYAELGNGFRILDDSHEEFESFTDFLQYVTSKESTVILQGSGTIYGLKFDDASLTYDLSQIEDLTRYWDQESRGDCHSCNNLGRNYISQNEGEWYCTMGVSPMIQSGCPKLDSKIKNSQGGPARSLDELMKVADESK